MSRVPVREHVPLAPLTTLGMGGPARFLVDAVDEGAVTEALEFARVRSCPVFVLGGGSNVLVADAGFPGLVLRVGLRGIRGLDDPGEAVIRVAAGEVWDTFVQAAVERQCAGVECLSGIPGSAGGTPVQNVGAYGQEVAEVITGLRALDRDALRVVEIDRAGCGFGYRSSIFNTACVNRYVILTVDFALRRNGPPRIAYPDLQRQFEGRSGDASLAEVREAVLRARAAKAMLLVPGDPDACSAGSFFRNPVVDRAHFRTIVHAARSRGIVSQDQAPPSFPAPDDRVKLSAAWLIERAGFAKGYARGRVGVSHRHTLALINRGGGTAAELLSLAQEIQAGVRVVFGVDLTPEPVFVGFQRPVSNNPGAAVL